ncbi:ash family protein, partial [Citrobacter sp. wls619]|uniref:ash family protein n=1 Tax=Citrobacter sp. wls619 TaxID=2576432 RepID=UPI001BAEC09A
MLASAKSGAGIDLLKYHILATHDALASFLCCTFGYISMVGWTRASQGAPVSSMAGKVNLVQSTTREIDLSGGGLKITYWRPPSWLRSPPKHT